MTNHNFEMKIVKGIVMSECVWGLKSALLAGFIAWGMGCLASTRGAVFSAGELTRTQPTGWLKARLKTQLTGLSGHPEAMSYPYDSCLWAGRIERMSDHGCAWWRYEQTAYYTDGLLRLGYALGDRPSVEKAESGIAYTLKHQTPDGLLGDECIHWNRDDAKIAAADCVGGDMWPQAVFFRAVKAYAEARAPEMRKGVAAQLAKYYLSYPAEHLALGRNAVSIEGMMWAYSLLGDRRLLELAERAYALSRADPKHELSGVVTDRTVYQHGVTWCEMLKVPMLLYAATGKKAYLEDALRFEHKLERDHMLPDGVPSSTEFARGNNVNWGHETCDIADFSWSLGVFLEVTGEGKWADRIERAVFNAGAGCVTPDFKALQYFSNPNQVICTSDSNHNPFAFGLTWMAYRPTHETECCAGNVHRIWPNYVARMWLRGREGAVVAALYGPSVYSNQLNGVNFTIAEKTDYPESGVIDFVFQPERPLQMDFRFRRPDWCEGMVVAVNGKEVKTAVAKGEFAALKREFRAGDVVRIKFAMTPVVHDAPPIRFIFDRDKEDGFFAKLEGDSTKSPGAYVTKGPLLYAFPVKGDWQVDEVEHAKMRGKKSGNPDFKCWNVRPAGPWNYALASREVKEDGKGNLVVKARRIKWELHENRMMSWIPEKVEPVSGLDEELALVPYGRTQLRLSVFPLLPSAAVPRPNEPKMGDGFADKGAKGQPS